MGWVKLDDGFFRHRKAIEAGRDGRVLFLAGLCYCGAGLTDGFIPDGALVVLAAETGITRVRNAADALVAAGLWHQADGGYRVHDFFEWQRSREEIAVIGNKRAEAGRKGGKQRASNLLAAASSKTKPETEADTDTEEGTKKDTPKPPQPVDWRVFETFWTKYPRKTAKDDARRAWQKIRPDDELAAEIMAGLDRLLPGYQAAEPRFVPHPSTFLNGRRWTDEPVSPTKPPNGKPGPRDSVHDGTYTAFGQSRSS